MTPRENKKVHFLADDPTLPTVAESEAQIAKDAEKARRHVARQMPGEAGKSETDAGKGIWGALGIGKEKK